jgi:hypothetical protein
LNRFNILLEDDYLDKFEEAIKISNKQKRLEISLSAQHIGDIVNSFYSMCDNLLYCIDWCEMIKIMNLDVFYI